MHMNANEPVTESKVKLWISAEAYIAIDPKWTQEEAKEYALAEARKLLAGEPDYYVENKEVEDVEL